jgi:hypothetical protein
MRYCPFCQRINLGHPQHCNYCGRTWYVRLCPRGHENPTDSVFCSECGSPELSETSGPRPWWLWLIKIFSSLTVLLLFLSIIKSLSRFRIDTLAFLLPVILLIAGYYLAISILPGPIKKITMAITKLLKNVCLKLLGICWDKIKNFFQ